VLHWLTAALVISLWALGQTIDWFPKGNPRVFARSMHISLGIALALVLVARIHWRFSMLAPLLLFAKVKTGRSDISLTGLERPFARRNTASERGATCCCFLKCDQNRFVIGSHGGR